MKLDQKGYTTENIVKAWKDASLKINPEYQRGEAWKLPQKQALIDSIFRGYPIPPLFLQELRGTGLGGEVAKRYEIVDGQQRIRALADYFEGKFGCLEATDKKLKLPASLRGDPAPWAGKKFDDLQPAERDALRVTKIDTYLMGNIQNPDEVRDLFIRLQSGTALTRQQIRDAWPGNVGPFVESLAGKLGRQPTLRLFAFVDGRSRRDDEDKDEFSADRQFCAQLLCLFLARETDPSREQGTGADELDALYHDYTNLDPRGPSAERFRETLALAEEVLALAMAKRARELDRRLKLKFKKLDIIALCCLLQDLTRRPNLRIDAECKRKLAEKSLSPDGARRTGKGTSGPAIRAYVESWREGLPQAIGIELDPRRTFNDIQKLEIKRRDGVCQICKKHVPQDEEEFDHFPVPWSLGGRTEVSNGRLVCSACHPRGRPAAGDL